LTVRADRQIPQFVLVTS